MRGTKPKDITGQRFGNLIAYEPTHTSTGTNRIWHCLCNCGHTTNIRASDLIRGYTVSCTRCNKQTATDKRLTQTWRNMLRRCYHPNSRSYKRYGAKGIRVWLWWHSKRQFFEWAMKHGYNDSMTIDRIDPNGDYEPDNCRFVTRAENTQNRWIKKTNPQTS